MTEPTTTVSIICPAYHEQDVLPLFHAELTRVLAPLESQYQFEILYIDDGSRDGTLDAMKAIAESDSRVRVLSFARNFGKEAALQAGLSNAEGDLIITMDTDLQHPPELIPQLLEKANGPVELVITVREEYQKPGWFNQLGTQTFYGVLDALSEIEIRKETSDYLLMKRNVADVLLQMQERHRYMKGLIHWMGFAYAEVAFTPKQRTVGYTKFPFRRLLALGKDCLFAFSKKPLTLASSVGTIAVLAGVVWGIAATVQMLLGAGETGWATHYLIVSTHLLAGAILIALGVLGEYLGRMWDDVRRRPSFVVKYDSHARATARGLRYLRPHAKTPA